MNDFMLKRLAHVIGLMACLTWTGAGFAQDLTLKDLYLKALKTSETVGIQQSRQTQAQERLSQVSSVQWPRLGLGAGFVHQDVPSGSTTDASQVTAKVTVSQPLFNGFKDRAILAAAKADIALQEASSGQNHLTLYSAVSQAYFDVLIAQIELKNLRNLRGTMAKRTQEILQRTRIGRSRTGDLLSAQSQETLLLSQVAQAETALDAAWDALKFLTGLEGQPTLAQTETKLAQNLPPMTEYVRDLDQRPDMVALKQQVEVAAQAVEGARSTRYPTVDLTGNYYLVRPKPLDKSKWDVGVALTLPLYEGGMIDAQVRENIAKQEERQLLLEQAKRAAVREIEAYYKAYLSQVEQLKILSQALTIHEKNYREQNRDYQNGLVNNLEILQAINSLEDSRRSLDRVKFQAQQTFVLLNAATGKIP